MARKSRSTLFEQFIRAYGDHQRNVGDAGKASVAADALMKVLEGPEDERTGTVVTRRLHMLLSEARAPKPVVAGMILRRAIEARIEDDLFDRLKDALGYRIEGERLVVVLAETREEGKTLLRGETERFLHVVTQESGGGRVGITSKLPDGTVIYGKYQKIP